MYNLFVSADSEDWEGNPFLIEMSRCVHEYTDTDIIEKYGTLDVTAIDALKRFPCIFAYESSCKKAPKFGIIEQINKRQGNSMVRIQYQINKVEPFLTSEDLGDLALALDIDKWEMNRTHWAVKQVNLAKELQVKNIILPSWVRSISKTVDITKHAFDVGLSFSGEERSFVESITMVLERTIGPNSYFYDNNYTSQLARPSLDTLLQDIYLKRSKLVVVFLSENYQRKEWCGVEFKAIREIIIKAKELEKVMFIRMDDSAVDGVFINDGYIDSRKYNSEDIATFIKQRIELL